MEIVVKGLNRLRHSFTQNTRTRIQNAIPPNEGVAKGPEGQIFGAAPYSSTSPLLEPNLDPSGPFATPSNRYDVTVAETEIARAVSMIESGSYEEAVKICKTVHANAIAGGHPPDIEIIKDKLLDAAFEFPLVGADDTARKIFIIVDSPNYAEEISLSYGEEYHRAAHACWSTLGCNQSSQMPFYEMEKLLRKAIAEKEYLKCAPYFLAKAYENGLYGVRKNAEDAQAYFDIASNRRYVPHHRKQSDGYRLMLEAQQSEGSVFSYLPHELINRIARMRVEASLSVQSRPNKKT